MQILQDREGRWLVEGSTGKAYHVKAYYDWHARLAVYSWACDCPGSLYGHECRHIKAVKAEFATKA